MPLISGTSGADTAPVAALGGKMESYQRLIDVIAL
jgi:hypothetical protein